MLQFRESVGGLDDFALYFVVSLVLVAVFLAVYVRITPYREFALIREGNVAAAASLLSGCKKADTVEASEVTVQAEKAALAGA